MQTSLVHDLGQYLEYGILGFSAILALLGFFIFYKAMSEDVPKPEKLKSARFFLVFSLIFLVTAGFVKIADGLVVPRATIKVEIEPWDAGQLARWKIEDSFFIETMEREKYLGDAIVTTVGTGAKIECEVYPLYARLEQLMHQVAEGTVTIAQEMNPEDLGIGNAP